MSDETLNPDQSQSPETQDQRISLSDLVIPELKKGDRLFNSQGTRWTQAWLGSTDENDWYVYAQGYKDAADLLIPAAEQAHGTGYFLIQPVLFLYRHYLELTLKRLFMLSETIHGTRRPLPNTHRLNDLWQKVKPFLWDGSEPPPDELIAIEACINELSAHELQPDAFRYPADLKGQTWNRPGQHFDVRHFSTVMGAIAVLLEGALTGLYEEWQQELENRHLMAEMEAEYGDFMNSGWE